MLILHPTIRILAKKNTYFDIKSSGHFSTSIVFLLLITYIDAFLYLGTKTKIKCETKLSKDPLNLNTIHFYYRKVFKLIPNISSCQCHTPVV